MPPIFSLCSYLSASPNWSYTRFFSSHAARAKVDLAANSLRDDQGASTYRAAEMDTLEGVILQRDRALALGRVIPTEF